MMVEQRHVSRRCVLLGEGGFGLAEVMVTMVIFSIVALGITMLMVSMIGSNDYARRFTKASQMAEEKLEDLRNECCLVVEPGTDTADEFTRSWNFVDNCPVDGLMKVTIQVSWLDHRENEHSTTLVALMFPS